MAQRTCKVEGCEKNGTAGWGWCKSHYDKWHLHGDAEYVKPPFVKPPCPVVVDGVPCPKLVRPGDHMCSMHRARMQRHGDPLIVLKGGSKPGQTNRGSFKVGNPKPPGAFSFEPGHTLTPEKPKGEQSWSWVGDDVGCQGAHERVKAAFGKASDHVCVDCGERARSWSYDKTDPNQKYSGRGPYSTDIHRYQPRCNSCHVQYDRLHPTR